MSSEYIPAIITASFALLTAVGAQFLAHYLQNKRIYKENDNRAFQELIFPFLPEILLFYETETDFRRGHDVEKNIDVKDLVERISTRIQFSNMELLSRYNELIKSEYFYDAKGDVKEIQTLRFFYAYLSYSLEVLNKKSLKEEELVKQLDIVRKKYGIWILVSEEIGYESSIEVMSLDFLISNNFYYNSHQDNLNELVYKVGRTSCTKKGYKFLESLLEVIAKDDNQKVGSIGELERSLLENSIL